MLAADLFDREEREEEPAHCPEKKLESDNQAEQLVDAGNAPGIDGHVTSLI
jgi:hypothetical protein